MAFVRLKFTKEQIKEMNELFEVFLNEIYDLWKISPQEEISFSLDLFDEGYDDFLLRVNKNGIFLKCIDKNYLNDEVQYAKKNKFIGNSLYVIPVKERKANTIYRFLSKSKEIRNKMELSVEKSCKSKKSVDEVLANVKRDLESNVYIDLPPTNNQHKIEVSREDGRNVGVIDFGKQTIKIITDGDIVLVDRRESAHVKRI